MFCGNSRKYKGNNKNGYYKAPPSMDILVKYVFELRRTCHNNWCKKVLIAYCHFNSANLIVVIQVGMTNSFSGVGFKN